MGFSAASVISPQELHQNQREFFVLDVREVTEFEDEGHIKGATNAFVGDLARVVDDLPKDKPIVVTCSVGHRGSLALSILLRAGRKSCYNLLGGMKAWNALGLPVSKKKADSFYYTLKESVPRPIDETISKGH